jgi:hypothetical protein
LQYGPWPNRRKVSITSCSLQYGGGLHFVLLVGRNAHDWPRQ